MSQLSKTPWARASANTKIERWENVLRVLESLTPEQRENEFDMSDFGLRTACGTRACAAGYCALDPWFKARGLKARWVPVPDWHGRRGRAGPKDRVMTFPLTNPVDFFGYDGANEIFYKSAQRPVEQVILEVRNYLDVLRYELDRKRRHIEPLARERVRKAIREGLGHVRHRGHAHVSQE